MKDVSKEGQERAYYLIMDAKLTEGGSRRFVVHKGDIFTAI